MKWHFFGVFLFLVVSSLTLAPSTAKADYTAIQNKFPIPAKITGTDFPTYRMNGAPTNGFTLEYTATNTITAFDRIDIPLCRFQNTSTGTIEMEVRSTTFQTGIVIASSTVSVNSGNVYTDAFLCGGGGAGREINATSTTFVLNNTLQTVSGVKWYFRFRFIGTDVIYFSLRDSTISENGGNFLVYNDQTGALFTVNSLNYSMAVTGRALGNKPLPVTYNASTTGTVCDTFDVGCYVSNAIAWAFVPDTSLFYKFSELKDDVKTKPPFGYFTSAFNAISDFNSSSTPQFTLATSSAITTTIFNPLRTGLNWLLLFGGLYWLYKRVTDITI